MNPDWTEQCALGGTSIDGALVRLTVPNLGAASADTEMK